MTHTALHPEPHPTPTTATPEPAGLTDAQTRLWTALTRQPGATAAELADAAGIGRSTASKTLTTFETNGLTHRHPGGFDNKRRLPDRWYTTDHTVPTDRTEPADDKPATTPHTEPHPHTAPDSDPTTNHTTEEPPTRQNPTGETTSETTSETAVGENNNVPPEERKPAVSEGPDNTPNPDPAPARATVAEAPSSATATTTCDKPQSAPGALRQTVLDHLRTHPTETFSATTISQAIDGSSSTTTNATDKADVTEETVTAVLDKLIADGRALRNGTSQDGVRYRSAEAPAATAAAAAGKQPRRAPGQLRDRVLEFLRQRPGEEWGPTGLSRQLEASSGAISNALDRLATLGLVRRTSDKPRRFTAADAKEPNPQQ
jgi:DNA-binding MarR family transcriptional regulator